MPIKISLDDQGVYLYRFPNWKSLQQSSIYQNNLIHTINCEGQNIDYLPNNLPSNIKKKFAGKYNITYLPEILPDSLQDLSLYYNKISNIDSLTNLINLEKLIITNNKLKNLPLIYLLL